MNVGSSQMSLLSQTISSGGFELPITIPPVIAKSQKVPFSKPVRIEYEISCGAALLIPDPQKQVWDNFPVQLETPAQAARILNRSQQAMLIGPYLGDQAGWSKTGFGPCRKIEEGRNIQVDAVVEKSDTAPEHCLAVVGQQVSKSHPRSKIVLNSNRI